MRDWYWIRHGPTHAKTMVGWTDLRADLSDGPALQRLGVALPDDGLIVSSDLSRAVETADALQVGRKRLPHVPGLREIHFGLWENLTHAQAEAMDRERIFAFWDRPGETSAPEGESWNGFSARVSAAVAGLEAALPPGPIIAVAHFGVILSQVQAARRQTAKEAMAHRIEPLSLTHIRTTATGAEVLRFNHRP